MKAWGKLKIVALHLILTLTTMQFKLCQSFITSWNGHLPLNNVTVLQKYFHACELN